MVALDSTNEGRMLDVVTELDPGDARLIAFAATVVAHGARDRAQEPKLTTMGAA